MLSCFPDNILMLSYPCYFPNQDITVFWSDHKPAEARKTLLSQVRTGSIYLVDPDQPEQDLYDGVGDNASILRISHIDPYGPGSREIIRARNLPVLTGPLTVITAWTDKTQGELNSWSLDSIWEGVGGLIKVPSPPARPRYRRKNPSARVMVWVPAGSSALYNLQHDY